MANEKQAEILLYLMNANLNLEDVMAEIKCLFCEKLIEGFAVYDDEMNAYHPGCAPPEFTAQAKAERKAAKKDHVGVRKQRKIDSGWNKRERKVAKMRDLRVVTAKIGSEIEEIETSLKELDPKFEEKIEELRARAIESDKVVLA